MLAFCMLGTFCSVLRVVSNILSVSVDALPSVGLARAPMATSGHGPGAPHNGDDGHELRVYLPDNCLTARIMTVQLYRQLAV